MSSRFPVPCPVSKMISAGNSWCGFAPFNFPGFAGTFGNGAWMSGGAPTTLGQLVLSLVGTDSNGVNGYLPYVLTTLLPANWPAIDPALDSVGSTQNFPALALPDAWSGSGPYSITVTGLGEGLVYQVTVGSGSGFELNGTAISGSTLWTATGSSAIITAASLDLWFDNETEPGPPNEYVTILLWPTTPRHYTAWDYSYLAPEGQGNIGVESGPSPWLWGGGSIPGDREIWGAGMSGGQAYLNLTITDDFSGLSGAANRGYDGGPTFGYPGDDTIIRTWTVNKYNGVFATTGPTPTPSELESRWMFPGGPWAAEYYAVGLALLGITSSPTQLVFQFGWYLSNDSGGSTFYPFTQTLQLAAEYDLSTAITECGNLLNATSFSALNWGQQANCAYNADGSTTVTVSSLSSGTISAPKDCAGDLGAAASGFGYISIVDGKEINMSTAQVDVCGPYCLKTWPCTGSPPAMTCVSGSVNGYGPVTIPVPALETGQTQTWTYLFPNCQCT